MIIAEMIGSDRQVEILDAKPEGNRKFAEIRKRDGSKYPRWTHGGWCEDSTMWVDSAVLVNVRQVKDD